jgi:hypothetical protein
MSTQEEREQRAGELLRRLLDDYVEDANRALAADKQTVTDALMEDGGLAAQWRLRIVLHDEEVCARWKRAEWMRVEHAQDFLVLLTSVRGEVRRCIRELIEKRPWGYECSGASWEYGLACADALTTYIRTLESILSDVEAELAEE